MSIRLICKRCHHVRPVNGRGYCASCTVTIDETPKRKPPSAQQEPDPETEEELAEASTDPAPAQEEPKGRETVPETAPQGGSPEASEEAEAPETRSESPASEVKP
ncbi:hypothetical protein LCGC14_1340590 [marine sediment metagenome]|uniref:Uncharacterized protein n=1 Tax=marine sediment metagenome TaxID=412755 RepID=A0A0F9NG69_9ZZZZ